jgi:hypothetical protein
VDIPTTSRASTVVTPSARHEMTRRGRKSEARPLRPWPRLTTMPIRLLISTSSHVAKNGTCVCMNQLQVSDVSAPCLPPPLLLLMQLHPLHPWLLLLLRRSLHPRQSPRPSHPGQPRYAPAGATVVCVHVCQCCVKRRKRTKKQQQKQRTRACAVQCTNADEKLRA